MLSGPTTYYVIKDFGYMCITRVVFFLYILPSEFHVIISIENGGGCLYLSGVKISDLVPFTVSQTLVDYQIPNWYLFGCFSLNKMPEISITRTILMI